MLVMLLVYQAIEGFRFNDNGAVIIRPSTEMNQPEGETENDEGSGGAESNLIDNVDKRHNPHLKSLCSCPSKIRKEEFSESYPTHYYEKVCDWEKIGNSASFCDYTTKCKEIMHKVWLLKYRPKDMDTLDKHELPRAIKKEFYWHVRVSDLRRAFSKCDRASSSTKSFLELA